MRSQKSLPTSWCYVESYATFEQRTFGWRLGDTPHATNVGPRSLGLSISPKLEKRHELADVIAAMHAIWAA